MERVPDVEPDAERAAVYWKAVVIGTASAEADSSYAFIIFSYSKLVCGETKKFFSGAFQLHFTGCTQSSSIL